MKTIYSTVSRRLNPVLLLVLMTTSIISFAAPPTTPLGFRFEEYSRTTAELFWLRSSGDPLVTGYELTKNGEVLGVFDALSYFDNTLEGGTPYEYTITAINALGERSQTVSVTVRVASSPTDQIANLQQQIAFLRERLAQNITGPVAATGQTTSYLPGDDGFWQKGYPISNDRFVVNVNSEDDLNGNGKCDSGETCNGTVTDTLSELIWLQEANCSGQVPWDEALLFANELSNGACGLNDGSQAGDWRLPNLRELISLANFAVQPVLPEEAPFANVVLFEESGFPQSYWSSTSVNGTGSYTFSLSVGWVDRVINSIAHPAWAVR